MVVLLLLVLAVMVVVIMVNCRGAGGGDVNLGAQRMYDTMKRLEAGGKA